MKSFWPKKYRHYSMMVNLVGLLFVILIFVSLLLFCYAESARW
jgi:hypothetical protein